MSRENVRLRSLLSDENKRRGFNTATISTSEQFQTPNYSTINQHIHIRRFLLGHSTTSNLNKRNFNSI